MISGRGFGPSSWARTYRPRRGFFPLLRRGLETGLVSVLALVQGSCSVSTTLREPFNYLPEFEQVIESEWTLCQNILICLEYPKEDVERITPEDFRWRVHSDTFTCGVSGVNGCYDSDARLIEFNKRAPWAIHHECGHAIMHKLNHRPGWKCFGHGYENSTGKHTTSGAGDLICNAYYPEESFWTQFCTVDGRRLKP